MWWTDALARARAPGSTALAALALAACQSPGPSTYPNLPLTPTEQYSIQVEEAPDQLALMPHADGLSALQRAALVGLVNRWRESPGASDLSVQGPAGGDAAAQRTVSEVLGALQALGVPAGRVRTGEYDPAEAVRPVLASFTALKAKGPDCEGGWDNLTSTRNNGPSTHFGCAVTANLAAMVADPSHLLAPAAVEAPDGDRRQTVLGKYRKGEVTASAIDQQASGAVSRAVN
jgi:pilus assembly protein CpaD